MIIVNMHLTIHYTLQIKREHTVKKTFASDKFLGNMKIAVLIFLVEYITSLLDYFLVGHVMGEEALSAFALLTPYLSAIFFVSSMISSGTAIMIAFEVGKGSRGNGNKYFQQGVILSVGVGLLLTLILFSLSGIVLSNNNVPPNVHLFMKEYYIFICLLPIWHTLYDLFFSVIWNAGGDHYCGISLILRLLVNIFASLILMQHIGIGGTGIGTILGQIAGLLVFVFYFKSKTNVFCWGLYFDIHSVIKMLQYSVRDSFVFLYQAVIQFIMNAFLMHEFGSSAVLVFSVIMNLDNLYLTLFNSPANAVSVILAVFVGEGNHKGIQKSMHAAERTALLEGIVVMLLLMVFAGKIPAFFGITTASYTHYTIIAVRIFAFASLFFPFIMLYSTYYLAVKKILLSMITMTLQIFIMPILFSIILAKVFGMSGIFVGFTLGTILTFLCSALILRYLYREHTYPLLLNSGKLKKQLSYDVPISKEGVMTLVYQVEADLKERNVDSQKIYRILLMIEENEMLVVERNDDSGGIIQCDLFLETPIRLVLRDSGPYSDATDQDNQIDSFRAYTASMIIGSYSTNRYLLTWGNNRIVCTFE